MTSVLRWDAVRGGRATLGARKRQLTLELAGGGFQNPIRLLPWRTGDWHRLRGELLVAAAAGRSGTRLPAAAWRSPIEGRTADLRNVSSHLAAGMFQHAIRASARRRLTASAPFRPRATNQFESLSKLHLTLWRPGILRQMIDIALDLFQLRAQLVARLLVQLQQDHAELPQRQQAKSLLIVDRDYLQGGVE